MITPRPRQHDNIVTLPVAHVIPEDGGGWLVLTHRGHAWLHGDRLSAIREKKCLDDQWRHR
jgi:hypothetical protein